MKRFALVLAVVLAGASVAEAGCRGRRCHRPVRKALHSICHIGHRC